jgi:N-acyl homoserine lactone hydrolase
MFRVLVVSLFLLSVPAQAGPRLYVFDCGSIHLADMALYDLAEDESDVRELSVTCYMVEHAKGRLLWEAGLPRGIHEAKEPVSLQGSILRYPKLLGSQLAAMDLTPMDISHVAVSHLHFDHTGALDQFPDSKILMRKAEWKAAKGDSYAFADEQVLAALDEADLTFIKGKFDVFGDGSVTLIEADGHTPGHQVMLVTLENTGPVLLVGDLYHTRESRTLKRPAVFNSNSEQTIKSMEEVEELASSTGARLWIEHDKQAVKELRKAPLYYD